jgi:sugar-specific transcriptional regulator TrmB
METVDEQERAVKALQSFGLSEYESKCFVALSSVPSGTANDVSELSGVPRTRVYDLAERLQERGLVEIQDGSPREFRALATDHALDKLQRSHEERLDSIESALRSIATPQERVADDGVWRITEQENVIERGQFVAARAEDELLGFFTEKALFRENCFRQAQRALDRDVDVILGSSDEGLRNDLRDQFPEATVWSPSLDWKTLGSDGAQVSRLVMADRRIVMLASIRETRAGVEETAIWGEGTGSELVLLCREMIGAKIDHLDRTNSE